MKNHISTAIIASALALLVPNNGAEAVGTVSGMMERAAAVQPLTRGVAPEAGTSFATDSKAPDPSYAWLATLGFLGFVAARRLRSD